jgi:hypothetical protein
MQMNCEKNLANLAEQVNSLDSKALTMRILVRQLADQKWSNMAEQSKSEECLQSRTPAG